jgi:hypothetical protein
MAIHDFGIGVIITNRRDVRIERPQVGKRRTHVRQKLAGVRSVKISHRRGEHHDVAGRLKVTKDQFALGRSDECENAAPGLPSWLRGSAVLLRTSRPEEIAHENS